MLSQDLPTLVAIPDPNGTLHLAFAHGRYPDDDSIGVRYLSDSPNEFATASELLPGIPLLVAGRWYEPPLVGALMELTPFMSEEDAGTVSAVLEAVGRKPITFITCMGGDECPKTGVWYLRGATRSATVTKGDTLPQYYKDYFDGYDYCHWDSPQGRLASPGQV